MPKKKKVVEESKPEELDTGYITPETGYVTPETTTEPIIEAIIEVIEETPKQKLLNHFAKMPPQHQSEEYDRWIKDFRKIIQNMPD